MHVFGAEEQPSEYNAVESVNSRQYYLQMQEQYRYELFQSHHPIPEGLMTRSLHQEAMINSSNQLISDQSPTQIGPVPLVSLHSLLHILAPSSLLQTISVCRIIL